MLHNTFNINLKIRKLTKAKLSTKKDTLRIFSDLNLRLTKLLALKIAKTNSSQSSNTSTKTIITLS